MCLCINSMDCTEHTSCIIFLFTIFFNIIFNLNKVNNVLIIIINTHTNTHTHTHTYIYICILNYTSTRHKNIYNINHD